MIDIDNLDEAIKLRDKYKRAIKLREEVNKKGIGRLYDCVTYDSSEFVTISVANKMVQSFLTYMDDIVISDIKAQMKSIGVNTEEYEK